MVIKMELKHYDVILKILAEQLEIAEGQCYVAQFERDQAKREVEVLRKKIAEYEQMFNGKGGDGG